MLTKTCSLKYGVNNDSGHLSHWLVAAFLCTKILGTKFLITMALLFNRTNKLNRLSQPNSITINPYDSDLLSLLPLAFTKNLQVSQMPTPKYQHKPPPQ